MRPNVLQIGLVLLVILELTQGKKSGKDGDKKKKKPKKPPPKPHPERDKWKEKEVLDYGDHEFGRLYQQWEDNDEDGPLPAEDLPIGHPDRPVPPIDMSIVKTPEDYLKQEKRSKTGMMFVNAKNKDTITDREFETISGIWQTGLANNHVESSRYVIGKGEMLFTFPYGTHVYEAKDYFLNEENVESIHLDDITTYGKYSDHKKEEAEKAEAEKKQKEKEERIAKNAEKARAKHEQEQKEKEQAEKQDKSKTDKSSTKKKDDTAKKTAEKTKQKPEAEAKSPPKQKTKTKEKSKDEL